MSRPSYALCSRLRDAGYDQTIRQGDWVYYGALLDIYPCKDPTGPSVTRLKCPSPEELIDECGKLLGEYKQGIIGIGGDHHKIITASDVMELGPGGEITSIPITWFISSDQDDLATSLIKLWLHLKENMK